MSYFWCVVLSGTRGGANAGPEFKRYLKDFACQSRSRIFQISFKFLSNYLVFGTREGAKAGRPSRRRMPSIDINRLASGAVLCLVIKSSGFSVPGSLNSLSSLERIRCWIHRSAVAR